LQSLQFREVLGQVARAFTDAARAVQPG